MLRSFLAIGLALGALGFFAIRYNQPTYSVRISGHETTWVKNYAHMRISVIPEEGWKLSKEAPTKIVLKHMGQCIEIKMLELLVIYLLLVFIQVKI